MKMANTAIVIARMNPMLMRPEKGADMGRSQHCSGVSARRSAGNSRADIARFYRRDLVVSRRCLRSRRPEHDRF
jgi:hypothetical protein